MARRVQTVPIGSPAGAQPWQNLDWMAAPFSVGWSLEGLGTPTGTYNIETTQDDPNETASPVVTAVVTGATANTQGVLGPGPVWGVRVNFTVGPTAALTFRTTQGMTSR